MSLKPQDSISKTDNNPGNPEKPNGKNDTTRTNANPAMTLPPTITLPVLYIDVDSLRTLLSTNPPPQKLVFEFFKTDAGEITLLTWGAKKNSNETDYEEAFQLNIGTETSTLPIENKNVIIGSFEISNHPPHERYFDDLKTAVDSGNYDYILFEPILAPFGKTFVIRCNIYGSETPVIHSLAQTATLLLSNVNPSPPRNSY